MATVIALPAGTPLLVTPDAPVTCATCGRGAALLVPQVVGAATTWVCLGCSTR